MIVIAGARIASPGAYNGERRDLVIEDDCILDIVSPGETPEDARRMDASGMLIIPGLINSHTHGHGNIAKGYVDTWSLEVFLNWAPITIGWTPEHHRITALLGACEMVRKGCTAAYDLFAAYPTPSPDSIEAVASAYSEIVMRAVVAPMMADRSLYAALPGLLERLPPALRAKAEATTFGRFDESVDACRAIARNWSANTDKVRFALAPTMPCHCSEQFLVGLRDLARDVDLGIHMHILESKPDAISALDRYGRTAVSYLHDLELLGPNFVAAHCVWLTDDDISIFADKGVMVAHNPGANMKLGSGVAPVRRMLAKGISVGIGTDGSRSSDNQNMFEAARLSSFASRLVGYNEAEWLSAADSFAAATLGGAKLLGREGEIGEIRVGAKADLVFLKLSGLNLVPLNDAVRQVVFCEDGTSVDTVMIGGEIIVKDGRFLRFDVDGLARQASAMMEELVRANVDAGARLAALQPYVDAAASELKRRPYAVERLLPRSSAPAA